ncbi:hypothetical protein MASR2M8_19600 [Opitutaceae bacterium]
MSPPFGPRLARWLVGGSLLWAGLTKAAAPSVFFGALLGYALPLPEFILRLVAISLPWLEVILGSGLLINVWSETLRPLAVVLCAVFALTLTQACLRGLEVACGCFGSSSGDNGWFDRPCIAVFRTLALLGAAIYALDAGPATPRAPR